MTQEVPADLVSTQLDCEVLSEHPAHLREEWDKAVLDLDGPIYMSFDWTRTWWQFYGKGKRLRLFVFRSEGRIVGLLPLYIQSIGAWPFRFKVARLVGASIPPKVFDPPVSPLYTERVWAEVLNHLVRIDGCDFVSIGPISEQYIAGQDLAAACRKCAEVVSQCDVIDRDVRTVYSLPSSFEKYFDSLDSKERKIRRKKLRDLDEAWAVRTDLVSQSGEAEREFESFVHQHTAQWQGEGRPGHFHAWPDALEFNRALVRVMAPQGRVRFFKLMAGEHVAANQYTFAFGKTLFAELPARIHGAQWARFSLGCTSQIKLIEAAIDEGFEKMDSGLGHYEYKVLTGGTQSKVHVVQVVAKRFGSLAKRRFYSRVAAVLQLTLQKGWYRRVSPRLPARFRGGIPRLLPAFDF